jgi:hypothetical protein
MATLPRPRAVLRLVGRVHAPPTYAITNPLHQNRYKDDDPVWDRTRAPASSSSALASSNTSMRCPSTAPSASRLVVASLHDPGSGVGVRGADPG